MDRTSVLWPWTAGGTCTGEHGIGMGRQECLVAERGQDGVALMAMIKDTLDPLAILNPGKIFAMHDPAR